MPTWPMFSWCVLLPAAVFPRALVLNLRHISGFVPRQFGQDTNRAVVTTQLAGLDFPRAIDRRENRGATGALCCTE